LPFSIFISDRDKLGKECGTHRPGSYLRYQPQHSNGESKETLENLSGWSAMEFGTACLPFTNPRSAPGPRELSLCTFERR